MRSASVTDKFSFYFERPSCAFLQRKDRDARITLTKIWNQKELADQDRAPSSIPGPHRPLDFWQSEACSHKRSSLRPQTSIRLGLPWKASFAQRTAGLSLLVTRYGSSRSNEPTRRYQPAVDLQAVCRALASGS